MPVRARRGIEALAILLVILLGLSVLVPLIATAAAQVTGFISTCGGPATPVPGATVTLVDANGIAPPATATTDGGGVYIFTGPPPASYIITANHSAYYGAQSGTPVRFDGSQTKRIDLCMYPHGTPTSNLAVTVLNGATPVPGATVAAFQPTNPTNRIQLVAQGTTGSTGVVNLTVWDATFQLRTSAALLPTVESSVVVSGPTSVTVNLGPVPLVLFGHVQNPGGAFLGSGVVAWLYDPAAANTSISRLIPGTVTASFFQFETARVPNAAYTLIVDANGYLSSKESITIPGVSNPHDVTLQPAPAERYDTTFAYGAADWNNLTAWRNLTLNADSTLPGLGPANLRDLRLQIDSTLGNGDGILSAGEIAAFQTWVCNKGPAYVATDGFFTTNGRSYNSTAGPCGMTVSPTLTNPNGGVWINTTTATPYKIKQAPPYLAPGAKTYFVNMTMVADSNISAYQNYTYTVVLPKKYELNTTTVVPTSAPVTTQNFTRFTVDPGVTIGKPQIRMTVSQSLNGTARAKVTAPTGKFFVDNATFTNYRAFVANNTNLTFSAGDSTDPNDHVPEANFTWRFTALDTRYGISPVYRYRQNGMYTVGLTMRETGGNLSYRNITLFVDDQLPVAKIRTNRTGSGSANGLTLKVDEGIVVRFDGGLSTDLAYPGTPGKILDSGYAWDFDGDGATDRTGRIQNYTFPKPGVFKVNLTVTDSVGWKGANATLNAQVNDTKAPVPAFDILDPSKDWTVITSPIEQRTIALNASKSTDDYTKLAQLNFTWTVPGPIVGLPTGVANHTFWGMNVSFAWQEWNNSYAVLLSVKDTGFRGSDAGKPNIGNLTRKINVQIDPLLHADLRIDAGTLKISPADPAEGDLVTITVNVTNKPGRAIAQDVTTEVRSISGGQTTVVSTSADWRDKNGTAKGADHTIASGATVKLVFSVRLYGQGNKTVQVYVADKTEPYTWITPENRASEALNVRQPWWQPYAIVAAVAGVIILFVFAMYFRRKVKAGEWRPLRGRRGEKVEGEEKKPRREVKEEKKRL